MRRPFKQIAKAEPGYFVLHYDKTISADGHDHVFKAVVIAWGVNDYGDVWPLTLDGANDGMDPEKALPILEPNGRVVIRDASTYDAESLWLAAVRDEHKGTADHG